MNSIESVVKFLLSHHRRYFATNDRGVVTPLKPGARLSKTLSIPGVRYFTARDAAARINGYPVLLSNNPRLTEAWTSVALLAAEFSQPLEGVALIAVNNVKVIDASVD